MTFFCAKNIFSSHLAIIATSSANSVGGFETVNSSIADRDTAVIRTRVTAAR